MVLLNERLSAFARNIIVSNVKDYTRRIRGECERAALVPVIRASEVIEARELALECQAHGADGTIAVLGHDDVCRVERRAILLLGLFLGQ